MDFPRYVFIDEGEEECTLGTYGTEVVEDKDEFDAAIKEGYKESITDLFEKPEPKAFKKAKSKKFGKKEVDLDEDF